MIAEIKITPAGIRAIRSREGLRLTAYQCQAGRWTIGYGHTAGVKPGQKITEGQAAAFLAEDLAPITDFLNREGYKGLAAYQYDALASLIFNIGLMNYGRSTLRRYIKAGAHIRDIILQISKWRYYTNAKGEKLISPGLSSRRESEARQYFGDAATLRELGYPAALIDNARKLEAADGQ